MSKEKKIVKKHYKTNLNKLNVPVKILNTVDSFIKRLVTDGSFNRLRKTS